MIDFQEELKKFKPVLEIEELQDGAATNDVHDMLEILQHLSQKMADEKE